MERFREYLCISVKKSPVLGLGGWGLGLTELLSTCAIVAAAYFKGFLRLASEPNRKTACCQRTHLQALSKTFQVENFYEKMCFEL